MVFAPDQVLMRYSQKTTRCLIFNPEQSSFSVYMIPEWNWHKNEHFISTRKNDLREQIPHTWPSSHENYFQSILGSLSYRVNILRTPPNWSVRVASCNFVVCYTAVFSVVTQCSSPQTAAENRTTFLSLCVCGLTNKPIMHKKFDNTWAAGC